MIETTNEMSIKDILAELEEVASRNSEDFIIGGEAPVVESVETESLRIPRGYGSDRYKYNQDFLDYLSKQEEIESNR